MPDPAFFEGENHRSAVHQRVKAANHTTSRSSASGATNPEKRWSRSSSGQVRTSSAPRGRRSRPFLRRRSTRAGSRNQRVHRRNRMHLALGDRRSPMVCTDRREAGEAYRAAAPGEVHRPTNREKGVLGRAGRAGWSALMVCASAILGGPPRQRRGRDRGLRQTGSRSCQGDGRRTYSAARPRPGEWKLCQLPQIQGNNAQQRRGCNLSRGLSVEQVLEYDAEIVIVDDRLPRRDRRPQRGDARAIPGADASLTADDARHRSCPARSRQQARVVLENEG